MVAIVSVIVPTRNRQQLAFKAIKSALTQTYQLIEVVVTDNSDDNSLEIMLNFLNDSRVNYFKNEKNIGPILNWRRGLDVAKGEYCLILPDDDYLINPFYIEEAVKIFSENDVAMIVPDCILSYPDINRIGRSGFSGVVIGQDFIRKGLRIPHIGNLFKKDIAIKMNPFNTNDILWSDIELWNKIMSKYNVYCHSVPSIFYLFHDSNIVLNMSKNQLVINSRFIRGSVETFADEELIGNLVMRYISMVNEISNVVDYNFVVSVLVVNNVRVSWFFVYLKLKLNAVKFACKHFLIKFLANLKSNAK
jgi:glycosyltransferase involved in cell wall biosynthesis